MAHGRDYTLPEALLEVLFVEGQDILRLLMERLLNALMLAERQAYLQAAPYQRTPQRRDQANGFKPKTLKTRLGPLELRVPQVRQGPFYPSVLTKGLGSERAVWIALAEMDVRGVSTRKVAALVEDVLGLEVSSSPGGIPGGRVRYPKDTTATPHPLHFSSPACSGRDFVAGEPWWLVGRSSVACRGGWTAPPYRRRHR